MITRDILYIFEMFTVFNFKSIMWIIKISVVHNFRH